MAFVKAVRQQRKLRLALFGPSGAGKSFTALSIATGLGGKTAVIDSENGGASIYADGRFTFDTCQVQGDDVQAYITALGEAHEAGYDTVIIDSLSHAWEAVQDEVDREAKRMKNPNSYTAWRVGNTIWSKLIRAIVDSKLHVIITARSKMEYEQVEENGRKKINKVGMAPQLRNGSEYEFDIVGDLDLEHNMIVTKSRFSEVDRAVVNKPDAKFGQRLLTILTTGEVAMDWQAECKALVKGLDDAEKKAKVTAVWQQDIPWSEKHNLIKEIIK